MCDAQYASRLVAGFRFGCHSWLATWLCVGNLLIATTGAEEFQVRGWHVEDGLPDGSITALAQSTDGYLWVGTPKGLVRFDGARFSRARSDLPNGLVDPRVSGLVAARDGSLWVMSERGVVTQITGGRFHVRHAPPELTAAIRGGRSRRADLEARENPSENWQWQSVSLLALDADESIWALLDNQTLLRFISSGERIAAPTNGLPAGKFLGVWNDRSGRIWVGKGRHICVFRDAHWVVFPLNETINEGLLLGCAGSQNGIWMGASGSNPEQKRLFHQTEEPDLSPAIAAPHSALSAILQDHQGRLWSSGWWSGLYLRDVGPGGEWRVVQQQGALAKCVVTCLFEDQRGAVWVGTIGEGLQQVTRRRVEMLLLPPEVSTALTTLWTATDGSIWLGTGGHGAWHWQQGRMTRYGRAQGLPSEDLASIIQDAHGQIWAGTASGLAVLQGSRFVPRPQPAGLVLAMFAGRGGNLWLGAPSKLVQVQGGTNVASYSAFDHRHLDIRGIAEGRDGQIWVAVIREGLWQVQGSELVPISSQLGLTRSDLRSLLCDEEGVLWIGTLNGGLFRWDGQRLRHYLTVDGFPDDSIIGLAADDAGNLWISSNNGLFGCSRHALAAYERGYSPKLTCWQLGVADGLANRGCSGGGQPVIARAADGRLWAADMVGAAVFNPAAITSEQTPTNILVESVFTDGVELVGSDSGFRVSTSSRRFEFCYTVPELITPKLLRFRHRLEGLDQDWVDAGNSRSASYSKLLPGDYRFRVMVSGGDGQWHEGGQALRLQVVPRLWELRWVQVSGLALFISAIGASLAWNQRRKLQVRLARAEMQHALEKERMRIARDIHDQLGASLTHIAMMSESPDAERDPPERLRSQLGRIAGKARSAAQTLNEIVWAVNPGNDNLPKLLDHLCMFSEELCDAAGVRCWQEVPTGLPRTPLKVEFRHNLALAVREALNNAIKHANASAIWIRVRVHDNVLLVEVEDDGVGFDLPHSCAGGNGLNNLLVRLQQIGGAVEVTSQPGHGTKVSFCAPLATG
jgi:signal transduction histidine kinase/ligand-binding sensor domain-containing protein